MSVQVINITPELEGILSFLYPTYTITDSPAVTSKFITHRKITSKVQRDALNYMYTDCVFISTQIFDEVWNEEKIVNECIDFARVHFKSRKTKFTPSKDNFIEDCKNFLVGTLIEEEESPVFKLFDLVGSNSFIKEYFQLIETVPYQQVFAALTTFISKLDKNSPSLFYKKKAFVLKDKVDARLLKAIDNYNLSLKGDGVAECKFIVDLFV